MRSTILAIVIIILGSSLKAQTHNEMVGSGRSQVNNYGQTTYAYQHIGNEKYCVEKRGGAIVSNYSLPNFLCDGEQQSELTNKYDILKACSASAAALQPKTDIGAFFSGYQACFCGGKEGIKSMFVGIAKMIWNFDDTIKGLWALVTNSEVRGKVGAYMRQVWNDHPNMTIGQKRAFNCGFLSQIAAGAGATQAIRLGYHVIQGARAGTAGASAGEAGATVVVSEAALEQAKQAALRQAGVTSTESTASSGSTTVASQTSATTVASTAATQTSVITPNVQTAWTSTMSAVEKVAAPAGARANGIVTMGQLLDEAVTKMMVIPQGLTREAANELRRQLTQISPNRLSAGVSRQMQNTVTGLNDFIAGRTSTVVIDKTSVVSNPIDSLIMSNEGLRANALDAATTAVRASLTELSPAERFTLLSNIARQTASKTSLEIPDKVRQALTANNEWSTFSANFSAFAADELAATGTPQALAEVAMQITTSVRTSGTHWILSEHAKSILSAVDPGKLRQVVAIAKQNLKQAPFNTRDYSSFTRQLSQELDTLVK